MSRLLWFIIGAGAATWWTKHKSMRIDCHVTRTQALPHLQSLDDNANPPHSVESTPAPETSTHSQTWIFGGQPKTPYDREEERLHIKNMSRQAGDTVAELSEATLDTLLSTVEVLKAKLAEHRAEREQQQKIQEEQKRQPPRYV